MRGRVGVIGVLVALLLGALPVAAQNGGTEIRAIWSAETFVLLNNSDETVDVSRLRFVTDAGEITAGDWVMAIDPRTGDEFSLNEMLPGSCLVAYFVGGDGQIPDTVLCNRIIGQFIIESFDDIVWSIPQGGFTAEVDGETTAECTIMRTACEVVVPLTGMTLPDESVPETVEVRAIWNESTLVLINVTEYGVDLSDLALQSADGLIDSGDWVVFANPDTGRLYRLNDVRPGSCLRVYLVDTEPDIPEAVECTRIVAEFTPEDVQNLVWDAAQGGFTPQIDGETGDACDIETASCDITAPVAASERATTGDEPRSDASIVGGVEVRALWTSDLLVLLNVGVQGADVSDLTLESANGALTPAGWTLFDNPNDVGFYTLDNMRPGSCLIAYEEGEQPPIPERIECARVIGEAELVDIRDVVWDVAQGGFEARSGDALSGVCAVTGTTSCSLIVPPSTGGE